MLGVIPVVRMLLIIIIIYLIYLWGRPFVVECMNPHKNILSAEFLSGLQKEINSSTADIAIRDLQVVTK